MTTNHHTAISTGANADAATLNAPLGQLDSEITDIKAGDSGFTNLLVAAATEKTILSGSITADQLNHTVTSETGSSDALTSISGLNHGQMLILRATTGHTITITNGSFIRCVSGSNETMTSSTAFLFFNLNGVYYCISTAGGGNDAADVTYTPTTDGDWDSDSDPGNVDDALDQLAAARTARAILRDEKSTGTDGGGSSSTTWNARDLNTEVYDNQNIVTISSNQFTPIAGEYKLTAVAPCRAGINHRLRLYNVTGAASVEEGLNNRADSGVTNLAYLQCIFTANGTNAYRIDHYTKTGVATIGLGDATDDGTNEVYLTVELEKIG